MQLPGDKDKTRGLTSCPNKQTEVVDEINFELLHPKKKVCIESASKLTVVVMKLTLNFFNKKKKKRFVDSTSKLTVVVDEINFELLQPKKKKKKKKRFVDSTSKLIVVVD